ncbi:MAG: type II secretion system F family protein [Candidatus Omnitrophica bacterium]|nr:type II secretion system F family protein [Candidatus Omnitrophota bacterium]
MPTFQYTARNKQGEQIHGKQEALTEVEAVGVLQGQGLIPTHIALVSSEERAVESGLRQVRKRHRRIKEDDLLFFVTQTGSLLEAGIPLLRTLEIVADQIESSQLNHVLNDIRQKIREGSSFKDAVYKNAGSFPLYWPYLIEAGETSGSLTNVLQQLAKNLDGSIRLKKKVVSALIYPCILIAVASVAVLVFLLKLIPIFENLFKSFNASLPPITAAVVVFSNFMRKFFLLILAALAGGVYAFRRYLRTPTGKTAFDQTVLHIPILGDFLRNVIQARICMILSTLIRSGLNLIQSIEISSKVAGNVIYERSLANAVQGIQQGKTLSACINESRLFAPMMVHFLNIGEESGKLAEMVEKAARYFDENVDVFATRLGTLVEPVILIVVGGIIGFLLVAMFMPIFSISQAIK